MKEIIVRFINRVYFGIYLYTRELDIPVLYMGRKEYYRGQLGFKICDLMVLLYTSGCLSFAGALGGETLLTLIKGNYLYRILYFILLIGISVLISQLSSFEGEKGLSYFEQFDQEPRSKKIKWMIISAFVFIIGILFFVLGIIVFPVYSWLQHRKSNTKYQTLRVNSCIKGASPWYRRSHFSEGSYSPSR